MTNNINSFCKKLNALGEFTGLTNHQLRQISTYIETTLPAQIANGSFYLKKNVTGLPRTIEYDGVTKQIFIHLKTHGGVPLVGEGGFKKVTKSIIYDPKNPEIVANCATKLDDANEAILSMKFEGTKGLAGAKAVTTHRKVDGTVRLNIFMKLYDGSLDDILEKNKLTLKEKVKIAYDAVCGLGELHKRGFVHRDVKPQNILVELIDRGQEGKSRKVRAVVSDFGLLYDKTKQKGALDFAHGTPFFAPTVSLAPESIQRKDFKVVDIYPLGVTLYTLFHNGKDPSWLVGKTNKKIQAEVKKKLKSGKTGVEIKKFLDKRLSKEISGRTSKLGKITSKSSSEKFESMILKMIEPKTQKEVAHSLDDYKEKLARLYKKL